MRKKQRYLTTSSYVFYEVANSYDPILYDLYSDG